MNLMKNLILCIALWLAANTAFADNIQMVFWYPGEAGSTSDAQPALDAFFDYINGQIAPDKISGQYFNTVPDGLKFISQSSPKIGIVSFSAYTIHKDKLKNATIIARTLPLPAGTKTESYTIVGRGKMSTTAPVLYSKQPLTKEFVSKYVFGGQCSLSTVQNILPVLKEIAMGTKIGGVILQPMEYQTLKNIGQPWAKELSVWHTSEPMPTAVVVAFGATNEKIQKIKNILLKIGQDANALPILETLRLKGFADAL